MIVSHWDQPDLDMPLMDRLTRPAESGSSYSRAELQISIQRDLENLLNTRCRVLEPPRDLTGLEKSLVNYGLPDFTGLGGGLEGARDRLRNELRRTIERFEPRLKNLRINILGAAEPLDRRLRFKIVADLEADEVVFQSILDQTTSRYKVEKGIG